MAADIKALLAAAKLPERSVELCLRADLVATMQDLGRQLVEAHRDGESDALDGGPARPIAEQIEAVRHDMLQHTIALTLRALPRRAWTALVAEHPPREGNDGDKALGMNQEAFFADMLRASVAAPALDDDDWARLDEVLSDGQWQALTNAAWAVNARDVDVPFSRAALRILRSSEPE